MQKSNDFNSAWLAPLKIPPAPPLEKGGGEDGIYTPLSQRGERGDFDSDKTFDD
jgi:hypothetical protein